MNQYKILEKTTKDGLKVSAIEFTDGAYDGLIFSYGRVEFIEDPIGDELKVKFDYDVYKEPNGLGDKEDLEVYLGDFLITLIAEQLKDNEIIYSGGTE